MGVSSAECEACLRSCLEANNLTVDELLDDEDLAVVRDEEWFPQLVKDVGSREEEKKKQKEEEKRKKRKRLDKWTNSSDEEELEGDYDDDDYIVELDPPN